MEPLGAGARPFALRLCRLRPAPHQRRYQPGRPGGPRKLVAGSDIVRSHYEMILDASAGIALGQEVPLGTHGHKFTVVGLMRNELTSSGDPVGYITLHDAQALQFELAPPAERREVSRGGGLQTSDQINAVIAKAGTRLKSAPAPDLATDLLTPAQRKLLAEAAETA
jgi:putative ABC transport system permease protein